MVVRRKFMTGAPRGVESGLWDQCRGRGSNSGGKKTEYGDNRRGGEIRFWGVRDSKTGSSVFPHLLFTSYNTHPYNEIIFIDM